MFFGLNVDTFDTLSHDHHMGEVPPTKASMGAENSVRIKNARQDSSGEQSFLHRLESYKLSLYQPSRELNKKRIKQGER